LGEIELLDQKLHSVATRTFFFVMVAMFTSRRRGRRWSPGILGSGGWDRQTKGESGNREFERTFHEYYGLCCRFGVN
jgi:hypothetical protein